MSLRSKLSFQSTLIFSCTLALVLLGTYFIFKKLTTDFYNRKLLERAHTAAYFYFEKDEVNDRRYREIEAQYRKISNESIRVYAAVDKTIYIDDKLPFALSPKELNAIMQAGSAILNIGDRQLAGIYYKDNQGDFIVVVSGTDKTGKQQLASLRLLLLGLYLISLPVHYFFTGFLSRKTFLPFSKLIQKVNSITTDNLHSRLEVPAGRQDEMKEMITTFNYFLERLESGVQIQRNFLKNASHELKTPLAAIIGDIEVTLNHPRQNEEYEQLLQSLKKDALHLKSLVEGLLLLSGLEMSGRQEMQQVRIDEVLWNVIEKMNIEHPDVPLSVSLDAIAEEEQLLNVSGNKELLFVAFSNILENAIKFSFPQPVSISAEVLHQKLVLRFVDKGPGIALADKNAVFELFYRSNQTRHIPGHGIGLYLTKSILDKHHIGIEIQSEYNKGMVFSLLFPAL